MNNSEIIFLIEESNEGGYEARAIGHSIYTEGEDLEDVKKNIKEAIQCHFDEGDIPSIVRLHFVREELMTV